MISDDDRRSISAAAIVDLLRLGGCLFEPATSAEATVGRLIRTLETRGLQRGRNGGFDPDEVVNLMIAEGLAARDHFWIDCYVATGRALVRRLCSHADTGPPDMTTLPPRRFALSFTRIFANVEAGRRLRLPLPIEDAHLADLSVVVERAPAPVGIKPGRIEMRTDRAAEAVTIEARIGFTAHAGLPHGSAPTAEERARWCRDTEGPIAVTQNVRTLAAALGGIDDADRVARFRDHLLDRFICGAVHPRRIDGPATDWVIEHRHYDCRIGSALLIALCRACAIPARLVGGYLLWAAPTEHYWAEIWLPDQGWTPFDLLAWDLSAGGHDPVWRRTLAGAIDYRMKTQLFPLIFTGPTGVAMHGGWHRVSRAVDGGTETRIISTDDGRTLCTDVIRHEA